MNTAFPWASGSAALAVVFVQVVVEDVLDCDFLRFTIGQGFSDGPYQLAAFGKFCEFRIHSPLVSDDSAKRTNVFGFHMLLTTGLVTLMGEYHSANDVEFNT